MTRRLRTPVRRELRRRATPRGPERRRRLGGESAGLTKGEITRLLNANELWFLVVANPDGYDYTFTPGNRLWRKNLREQQRRRPGIPSGDGVDPNRNFPTSGATTTRAPRPTPPTRPTAARGPASEPETTGDGRAHASASASSSRSTTTRRPSCCSTRSGFQQTTYTADDPIYRALSGTDDDPAIKGQEPGAPDFYDPDVGAELYITNGETTDHAHAQVRHAGVDARDGRLRSRPRRRRQRLRVPGLRGRPPGRVREERAVRARPRALGGGPGQPGLAPRQRGRADFEITAVRRVLRRPAGRRGQRQARARQR